MIAGESSPAGSASPPRLERALRQVVVGYRSVGALWLAVLAFVAVIPAGGVQADARVVAVTVGLVSAWTIATAIVAVRRPTLLPSAGWLLADVAVAAATIFAPSLAGAGAGAFYGGYPFSAVLLAATTRGLAGGLPAGAALAAVALARLAAEGAPALPEALASALLYLVGAGVVAWAAGVLRRQDGERRLAEAGLAAERAARIRSEERADAAAHLHDSVLQSLALIQRRSGEPAEVTTLARRCERELRRWLAGAASGGEGERFREAVTIVAADVEAAHHVTVDVVAVGDAPLDEALAALVAAAREALVNAAKHAGVDAVSLYAEAGSDVAEVFVRDRGAGFDPAAVAGDRRGIRESIIARMRRHGGDATVQSSPGQGTEVRLHVPHGGRATMATP